MNVSDPAKTMRKAIDLERWEWDDGDGPARLAREIDAQGIARFRLPDAAALSERPRTLFGRLFRPHRTMVRTERLLVQPRRGQRSIVGGSQEAAPHVDDDELMPAHVQLLCCVKQAERGGATLYVDSWAMLERIRVADPGLFRDLFTTWRLFRYRAVTAIRPTFSIRYGNLVCSQAPVPPSDPVGQRLQPWLDEAPRYEVRAEPGDVCVINHQRMMHGRHEFVGERTFVRVLYWFAEAFDAPASFVEPARAFAAEIAGRNTGGPTWVREWLAPSEESLVGLRRLAAVMAYISGEDCEQVAASHGVPPLELVQWTARALSLSARALGQSDATLVRAREVIDAHVTSVLGRR